MAQVTSTPSSSITVDEYTYRKRSTDDVNDDKDRKRKNLTDSATQLENDDKDLEGSSPNATLLSGISLMKLKRYGVDIELLKLPRFGAKLSAAPADLDRLHKRLNKIYKSKLQAFTWPRYREIVLTDGAEGATKKQSEGFVGRLNSSDMTVEMKRFRGTFSPYFGRHYVDHDGEARTTLSPFETYFLMDMGTLEVNLSDSCVLAVEDVRAMMEAKVFNFSRRYTLFSEIHRATQLYAKNYGTFSKSSLKKPKKLKGNRWNDVDPGEKKTSSSSLKSKSSLPQMSSLPSMSLPEVNLTDKNSPCDRKTKRTWRSVEEAREILRMEEIPISSGRESKEPPSRSKEPLIGSQESSIGSKESPAEIPPFCFIETGYPLEHISIDPDASSELRPDSLDVAFTCYSKISAIGTTTPQFDVAVMDFRQRNIPIADLFLTLANRSDPTLPLYVAKEDMGQLNGFAAVLANIPTVFYQGTSDDT